MSMTPDVMPAPTISVVLSVLNGERYLHEAIDSILAQTFTAFELIAVDDGSTDATGRILDAYAAADRRVRVAHQENRGLVEALNRGVRLARGRYLARMDADDVALPNRLATQLAHMEDHPEVAVLGSSVEVIDSSGRLLRVERNPLADADIRAALASESPFWHPSVMLRASALRDAGGYRKAFAHAEDLDLWLRLAERGRLANLAEPLLRYRLHPQQVTVRKCRQMALSNLAARTAARLREQGKPDPFSAVEQITPELLVGLGVSATDIAEAIASRYVWSLRTLHGTGQVSAALEVLAEMRETAAWTSGRNRIVAELCLLRAGLLWSQGQHAASLTSLAMAVMRRPLVLGRVIRRAGASLSAASA